MSPFTPLARSSSARGPFVRLGAALALGALIASPCLGASAAAPASGNAAGPSAAGINHVLTLGQVGSGEGNFLPADRAFRLFAEPGGPDRIRLSWEIAPGYYLYRSRLKVAASGAVQLGQLVLPEGRTKTDEFFGTQQIYHDELVAMLPVARAASATALTVPLRVTYQGCADAGLCYPPITKTLAISLPPVTGSAVGAAAAGLAATGFASGGLAATGATTPDVSAAGSAGSSGPGFVSEQDRYASVVRDGSLAAILAFFYAAGLVLAFTPCVLPMVPIVSGLIVGGGRSVTVARGFALSLTYVIGMALTYTAAGIAVAAGGQHVQAAFEQPWIVTAFAALFVLLALSMFGMFTLQMPAAIQTRLAGLSNRQSAGTFGGVLVMGALSALIVTTCVAPALVGALVVIGQSGDMLRGGIALFVMGLGMGTPLVAVGASAGKLLPKAGAWMDIVKRLFGALMLAVAAWMLVRIVPERFDLILWAVPALVAAATLWHGARALRSSGLPLRLAAAAAGVYGLVLIAGAALGGTDPLSPLPQLGAPRQALTFQTIKSVADLQRAVAQARAVNRPVMLDFYADWCVSCKEMEKYTFTAPAVETALRRAVLLRADVTRNDSDDQALLQHFGIYGPPTIAFYGANGEERRNLRVVGYMKPAEFIAVVDRAMGAGADGAADAAAGRVTSAGAPTATAAGADSAATATGAGAATTAARGEADLATAAGAAAP